MQKWEYARFYWDGGTGRTRRVMFTHQSPWEPIAKDMYVATLRRLGEAGWELVGTMVFDSTGSYDAEALYFKRPLAG